MKEHILLIPEELKVNFTKVVDGEEFLDDAETSHCAFPAIFVFLRRKDTLEKTDDQLVAELTSAQFLKQLLTPDRDLNTALHELVSFKKFKVIEDLKQAVDDKNLMPTLVEEAVEQLKYLRKYHFKFTRDTLDRIYSKFDYLYEDFDDFFDSTVLNQMVMDEFRTELENITNIVMENFESS